MSSLDFMQIDVFADRPYTGNPLAVFYDAVDLSAVQMQAIAREMNLSETTFVTEFSDDAYSMRIFTPSDELPFAGHPTIGTTWALRHLGRVTADAVTQTTAAGPTTVTLRDDILWFDRSGAAEPDSPGDLALDQRALADALSLEPGDIGLDGSILGGSGPINPGFADAGLRQLVIPLRDLGVLERSVPRVEPLMGLGGGAYCFTAVREGELRARGFFPGFGNLEDPGTGSAAAALGIYLADRFGDIEVEILQGVEMGRPCHISVAGTAAGSVQVGGRCELVLTGRLEGLP